MKRTAMFLFLLAMLGTAAGQNSAPRNSGDARDTYIRTPSGYTLGENMVGAGGSTIAATPAFVDASVQSGADGCAKISAAIQVLCTASSTGGPIDGVVDARGITGTQSCSTQPFIAANCGTSSPATLEVHGTLLLGGAVYQTSSPWIVPNRWQLTGLGSSNNSPVVNTVIQATSSFSGSAVVELGDVTTTTNNPCPPSGSTVACFGVQVTDLMVDCNNVTGAIGGLNQFAQEGSFFSFVQFRNCPVYGYEVITPGGQNSGPYEENDISYTSSCSNCNSTFTEGVFFNGDGITGTRGILGGTISGAGATTSKGLQILGARGVYTRIHCEYYPTCFYVGSSSVVGANTNGVTLIDDDATSSSTSPTNGTTINPNLGTIQNITIIGNSMIPNGTSAVLVNDLVTNTTVSDSNVSLYALGQIPSGSTGVVPVFYNSASNGTLKTPTLGTTSNCAAASSGGVSLCGSAAAGAVTIPGSGGTGVTVATSAVTANSQILVFEDASIGSRFSPSVMCNTGSGRVYKINGRSAGVGFSISSTAVSGANPACVSYQIIN